MSTKFDALCYIRIFSDNGDKVFDRNRWRVIPVKHGHGFNYISHRLHCLSKDIGITIAKICTAYDHELVNLLKNGDECQLYVWLKRGGRIEKLNTVEITEQSMRLLSSIGASICFSVDPGFPNV